MLRTEAGEFDRSFGLPPGAIRFIHEASEPSLYEQLLALWRRSTEVHVAAAFVSVRMLNILMAQLRDSNDDIEVRFLTGLMNGFNEPRVLEKLLQHFGPDNVRLYHPEGTVDTDIPGFHAKSYMFHSKDDRRTIIVGSSNLTTSAILGRSNANSGQNVEWNLLIRAGSQENDGAIHDIYERFGHYWARESVALDEATINSYRDHWNAQRDQLPGTTVAECETTKDGALEPRAVQGQALVRLESLRRAGLNRAAIIGATGIGKTMIAAFDTKASGARRILFVAHRFLILQQAQENFFRIFGGLCEYHTLGGPEGTRCLSAIVESAHSSKGPSVTFAMIQTLSDPEVYQSFNSTHFDYLIVDEFHHASAPSYGRILAYFNPVFLLGLTATPERLDGRDVLELCDYNIAFEVRLFEAIDQRCLTPFLYFAIYDPTDYTELRWTGIGYDEYELEKVLSNDTRAELIGNTIDDHLPAFGKVKGIAFCANVGHARYMAMALQRRGHQARCLTGDTPEEERQEAIRALGDESDPLNILFTVDVLNEGIDIPALTHILMLRPTQSFTIFLQQLGRGLRLHPLKEFLIILDFVGNYRNNYVAPLALSGYLPGDNLSRYEVAAFKPPQGCFIHTDLKVEEIWEESTRAKFAKLNTKDRLKRLYEEIWDDLGRSRSPCLMDFVGHPLCSDPMAFLGAGRFGSWLRTKEYCGGLNNIERSWLDTPAEKFLQHLERELSPAKSYKMVVLLTLLEMGPETIAWKALEIAERFKAYYLKNPLRIKDYEDLARSQSPTDYPIGKVVSHLKRMPLHYLSDKPEKFFTLDGDKLGLKRSLHIFWAQPEFRESVLDRVHFGLARYWERKKFEFPAKALS